MKKSCVLGLIGFLFFLPAMGGENSSQASQAKHARLSTVPPNKEWLACSMDSTCSATYLSCHGWIAINRSHESDVQHWYSTANTDLLNVVECSGPSPTRPKAVCRARTCKLK
jgi:hypothetical protein